MYYMGNYTFRVSSKYNDFNYRLKIMKTVMLLFISLFLIEFSRAANEKAFSLDNILEQINKKERSECFLRFNQSRTAPSYVHKSCTYQDVARSVFTQQRPREIKEFKGNKGTRCYIQIYTRDTSAVNFIKIFRKTFHNGVDLYFSHQYRINKDTELMNKKSKLSWNITTAQIKNGKVFKEKRYSVGTVTLEPLSKFKIIPSKKIIHISKSDLLELEKKLKSRHFKLCK